MCKEAVVAELDVLRRHLPGANEKATKMLS
jgi:hypothetical protein